MSSQEVVEQTNKVVLQNKDMMDLMGLANLDRKLSKANILKINIGDALNLVNNHLGQIEIRLYGNLVFAISKGILRSLNVITLDLRETLDMIRKNVRAVKRDDQAIKAPKPINRNLINAQASNTTETRSHDTSIEVPLNVARRENITIFEKSTPHRPFLFESGAGADSLPNQSDFANDLSENRDLFGASAIKAPFSIDNQMDFELSTPSKLGDFISPKKQKHAFSNLDQYLESVRRGNKVIFEEEEESDEKPASKMRRRGVESKKKPVKRVEFNADLETRWDYDETPNVGRMEVEAPREKTTADLFIERVNISSIQPMEQRVPVQIDDFANSFTTERLNQFNQKTRTLRAEEFMHATGEKDKPSFISRVPSIMNISGDERAFPAHMDDDFGTEVPMNILEGIQEEEEQFVFQPSRLDEIGKELDMERFEGEITANEVMDSLQRLTRGKSKKDKNITFERLTDNLGKAQRANMFYEILNLTKEGEISMKQDEPFEDIEIHVF